MRRTFTRRNGEKLTIDIEIDMEKLAEDMAHTLANSGKSKATRLSGAIVAKVVENA